MPELKPCPFCGGLPKFGEIEYPQPNWGMRFIECTKCHASSTCMGSDKEDAKPYLADLWNQRVGS